MTIIAEARYVAILSSSKVLQMKLPQHIKERAIQLKPMILEQYEQMPEYRDRMVPPFILSIE